MVDHVITQCPLNIQYRPFFKNNRPSMCWIKSLLNCHPVLALLPMRGVEEELVQLTIPIIVGDHISRVQVDLYRFSIRHADKIFNLYEWGVSFKGTGGRRLPRGVVVNDKILVTIISRTRRNLDRCTFMEFFNAHGKAFTAYVILPVKQPHYQNIGGGVQ